MLSYIIFQMEAGANVSARLAGGSVCVLPATLVAYPITGFCAMLCPMLGSYGLYLVAFPIVSFFPVSYLQ